MRPLGRSFRERCAKRSAHPEVHGYRLMARRLMARRKKKRAPTPGGEVIAVNGDMITVRLDDGRVVTASSKDLMFDNGPK